MLCVIWKTKTPSGMAGPCLCVCIVPLPVSPVDQRPVPVSMRGLPAFVALRRMASCAFTFICMET